MTIKIHTIGSAIIMPQYWKMRGKEESTDHFSYEFDHTGKYRSNVVAHSLKPVS